jgi:hypothetical protein
LSGAAGGGTAQRPPISSRLFVAQDTITDVRRHIAQHMKRRRFCFYSPHIKYGFNLRIGHQALGEGSLAALHLPATCTVSIAPAAPQPGYVQVFVRTLTGKIETIDMSSIW